MRRLPDDIRREINRAAHVLAQWAFIEHRRRLEVEALALLKAGRSQDDVIAQLSEQPARDR